MSSRTDEDPLVSVVVPTYYRNDLLAETIRSVRAQSYSPIELIVVDDSGDGHAEPVATEFDGVRYLELTRNRGANAARTAGARRADGRFVHFLDDDDVLYESKIERQVRVMRRNPDVGVVYTGIDKTGDRTDLPKPSVRGDVLEFALMFEMWPCMNSTMLIREGVLREVLPLSDRRAANDLELMIRLARRTSFEFVDEPLLFKRIDDSSLGSSMDAVSGRIDIVEAYDDLYAAHADSVRRTALANTYETEGALLLRREGWSMRAIGSLLRHLYYAPTGKPKALSKVVAACLGKPGWRAANRVSSVLSASRN
ncbi:glycosyltransferase family 2 protein [Halosimplex amylolyticum]|uniref:glycosyltransferase family 2 protein n=1 Tax=Halosimplex amylolyticum TaxID=3396616 RepID=UPI003F56F322